MRGYLLPHPPILLERIGGTRRNAAQKTLDGYQKVKREIEEYGPDITVIITPHGPLFRDGLAIYATQPLIGDFRKFGAPELEIEFTNDETLAKQITKEITQNVDIPVVLLNRQMALRYDQDERLDHGAMIPLMMCHIKSPVVVINYGLLSYKRLYEAGVQIGKLLAHYKSPLIIASGDLSHKLKEEGPYQYDPAGPAFDHWLIEAFTKGDILSITTVDESQILKSGECGMRSIEMMLGVFDQKGIQSEVISYEGPFGVGYGIVRLTESGEVESLLEKMKDKLKEVHVSRIQKASDPVKLAYAVVEKAVIEGEKEALQDTYPALKGVGDEQSGVFVSIHTGCGLRGCIGTFLPVTGCVREEIIRNAIQASLHDPRFAPISAEELEGLVISVDYLSAPENIVSEEELDPKKYGVIVSKGYRRGLLLPQLEGVDTIKQQIEIAKKKAGIDLDAEVTLQRFEVIRYE